MKNLNIKLRSMMGMRTRTTGVPTIALHVLQTGELKSESNIPLQLFLQSWGHKKRDFHKTSQALLFYNYLLHDQDR